MYFFRCSQVQLTCPGQIQGLAAVLSALAAARESLTLGPGVATTVATLLRAAAKSLLVEAFEDGDNMGEHGLAA